MGPESPVQGQIADIYIYVFERGIHQTQTGYRVRKIRSIINKKIE